MVPVESVARKVVLTGSECTGKTTLAADLARHYGTVWVPEYVRGYAESKDAPLVAGDVEPIAHGQIAAQDAARERARSLIILDTDLLSTVVYAEHYYGACPDWISAEALARRADLYLLCGIDAPWTADLQRDRPDSREAMQALFRGALNSRAFRFVDVRGDWRQRFQTARQAIDELVAGL
jgi:NadR type nicotinamide-nucleotide adenylyltransferase